MAAAESLLTAALILIGAGYFVVRAGALAADAHQRDLRVSEPAFTVTFFALAMVALAIAVFAVVAVRALWAGRRWGWWSLAILATLELLSMLGRLHTWLAVAQVLPTIGDTGWRPRPGVSFPARNEPYGA